MPAVEFNPEFERTLLRTAGVTATRAAAEFVLIRAKMYAPAPAHDPSVEAGRVARGNPRPSTQHLRNSLHIEQNADSFLVGTDVDYGAYQEFGTRRMQASPFLLPALSELQGKVFPG